MRRTVRIEWFYVFLFTIITAVYINTMGWLFIIGDTGVAYYCGLLAIVSGVATVFYARKKEMI